MRKKYPSFVFTDLMQHNAYANEQKKINKWSSKWMKEEQELHFSYHIHDIKSKYEAFFSLEIKSHLKLRIVQFYSSIVVPVSIIVRIPKLLVKNET